MFEVKDPYIKIFLEISLPLLATGIISRSFPSLDFLYYIVPALLAVYILLALTSIKSSDINYTLAVVIFLFPVYSLLTSLWSVYPVITLQRSLYLMLLYAGIISAVYLNKKYLPENGIEFLIPANIVILLISLTSLISGLPENSWTGGNGLGFMGFAGHQNTLASAVMFTLPGILLLWSRKKKLKNGIDGKKNKSNHSCSPGYLFKEKIIHFLFFLLVTANVLLITLTYSRAVMLAIGTGLLVFLIITKSYKALLTGFLIVFVIFIMFLNFQSVNQSINKIFSKHGWDVLATRTILWQPSFEAAKLGGVNGLGYGVSSPDIVLPEGTGSYFKENIYIREKGNSTLALIEETGVIGMILFVMPLVFVFIKRNDNKYKLSDMKNLTSIKHPETSILIASLAAFILHAQFEAWWVGPGSIQLPLFLVYLGMLSSICKPLNVK
ncbi:MAG: O-antigen ligase family protein [Ignavibacterium sp.]|nr:O-antigen ligase family protein [Ignavibacterium sp.]